MSELIRLTSVLVFSVDLGLFLSLMVLDWPGMTKTMRARFGALNALILMVIYGMIEAYATDVPLAPRHFVALVVALILLGVAVYSWMNTSQTLGAMLRRRKKDA